MCRSHLMLPPVYLKCDDLWLSLLCYSNNFVEMLPCCNLAFKVTKLIFFVMSVVIHISLQNKLFLISFGARAVFWNWHIHDKHLSCFYLSVLVSSVCVLVCIPVVLHENLIIVWVLYMCEICFHLCECAHGCRKKMSSVLHGHSTLFPFSHWTWS